MSRTGYGCLPLFARSVRLLRPFDGDVAAWWADFRARPAFTRESARDLALLLGAAVAFTPIPPARAG